MKTLLNRQLSESQRQEVLDYAYSNGENQSESFDGVLTFSMLKAGLIEVLMQANLIEKEVIDYSKMSVRELRGYALNDNDLVYDSKLRKYVKF